MATATKHVCSETPERCYRHLPYSVHPVTEAGMGLRYRIYDPAHGDGIYVGGDGRALSDTRATKSWTSRAAAETVAAKLNERDGRFEAGDRQ